MCRGHRADAGDQGRQQHLRLCLAGDCVFTTGKQRHVRQPGCRPRWLVAIVPDSGAGELADLSGTMKITSKDVNALSRNTGFRSRKRLGRAAVRETAIYLVARQTGVRTVGAFKRRASG